MIAYKPRRPYSDDIDIVEEITYHLTNRQENHRVTVLPNQRLSELNSIHIGLHAKDMKDDYIQAHVRMFERAY